MTERMEQAHSIIGFMTWAKCEICGNTFDNGSCVIDYTASGLVHRHGQWHVTYSPVGAARHYCFRHTAQARSEMVPITDSLASKMADHVRHEDDKANRIAHYVRKPFPSPEAVSVNLPTSPPPPASANPARAAIFGEIDEKRIAQIREWGPNHDAKHDLADWANLICRYPLMAIREGFPALTNRDEFRKAVLVAASVAVACLEALEENKRTAPAAREGDEGRTPKGQS